MRRRLFVSSSRTRTAVFFAAFLFASAFLALSDGQAVAASPSSCAKPLVIAVHGMGEGPDENGSGKRSVMLTDTLDRLRNLAAEQRRPQAESVFLRYPTIAVQTLTDPAFWRNGDFRSSVKTASRGLTREVSQARDACPNRQVALLGYSLGAWIVDDYLAGLPARFQQRTFSGVVLYGDPEWPAPAPGGLAREFGQVNIDPYRPQGLAGRFLSLCLPHDVVCNASHDPAVVRAKQAASCALELSNCAHRRYHLEGATERGAAALYRWTT